MQRGGDSIGRILVIEFSERDSVVFDEVMEVLKQRPELENLQLKDESLLSIPGLEIYPNRRKIFRGRKEINLTVKEYGLFYLLKINRGRAILAN